MRISYPRKFINIYLLHYSNLHNVTRKKVYYFKIVGKLSLLYYKAHNIILIYKVYVLAKKNLQ